MIDPEEVAADITVMLVKLDILERYSVKYYKFYSDLRHKLMIRHWR